MGVRSEVGLIPALQGVRGVALLWVIAFHYRVLRDAAGDPWVEALQRLPLADAVIRNGYLGVDLFFLLSGFLLTLPWLLHQANGQPPPGARDFYLRRVRRIVPAYYVHLVLLFVVALPALRGFAYWRQDFFVVVWNGIAHGLFIHNTSPLTSGSMGLNGALWTLAIEAQFYLLLPLLARLLVRRPWLWAAVASGIAALWRYAAAHDLEPIVRMYATLGAHWGGPEDVIRQVLATQQPAYLAHFALGSVLGHLWLERRARPPATLERVALLAGSVAALVALALFLGGRATWGEHTWIVTTAGLAMLLYAASRGDGIFVRAVMSRGVLAWIGKVSYSGYLYHLPVLLIGIKTWPGSAPALLPGYLLATALLAWVSWRYVEDPNIKAGHREHRDPQRSLRKPFPY
jgi:peptidoglycan/LPS O-acetylase OafA/YrhL